MSAPTDGNPRADAVAVDGASIECRFVGERNAHAPALVFLHEGLGSASLWRDFPGRLCARAGLPGVVCSRRGYGRSSPHRHDPGPDFMHEEATIALPALLRALGVERPILFGHSDGASIALIHAGTFPGQARAVVALAPHLFVEPVCVESIATLARAYRSSGLRERLARHHDDADATFRAWSGVWLSPQFAGWNIEREVAASRCPVLAIQGEDDQYGTLRQIDRIAELRPGTQLLKLSGCRHSPHLDRPEDVIDATVRFLGGLGLAQESPPA